MKKEPISPALFCQEQREQIAPEKEQIGPVYILSRATGANRSQSFFKKSKLFIFSQGITLLFFCSQKTSDSLKKTVERIPICGKIR